MVERRVQPKRIMERHEDVGPLLAAFFADTLPPEVMARYRGTELIQCGGDPSSCTRAIIAHGPLDMQLTLELVDDEGWSYERPWHYCPEHTRPS